MMRRSLLVLVLAVPLVEAFCCYSAQDVTDMCGTCWSGASTQPGDHCHDEEKCTVECNAKWCDDNDGPVPPPLTPVARFGALKVDNVRKRLVSTRTGEIVQLVGMSLFWSNKGWHGDKYWNADVVHELATKWPGLSVIRASVGVEANGGYISEPEHALSVLRTVVDAAIAEGLYVIVCWHSHDAEEDDVKQHAKEFFALITEEYAGVSNVLYNVYNEPEPATLWPEIKAYAEEVLPYVREHAPDAVVLVGTERWAQKPQATALDPITSDENIMYGVHFYAGWQGHNKIRNWIRDVVDDIPIFIDEWGQGCPHIECDPIEDETQTWMALLDEFELSHVNWALNDKQEGVDYSLSALNADASTAGGWTDEDFTVAGASTKAIIARYELPATAAPTVTPAPTSKPTNKPTPIPTSEPTVKCVPPSDVNVSVTLTDQEGYTLTLADGDWTFTRHNINIEISNNEAAVALTHVEVDIELECPPTIPDCAYFRLQDMYYPGFTDVVAVLADNDNPIGYHYSGSHETLDDENVGYFVKSLETGSGRFEVVVNSELDVDFDVNLVATVTGKTCDVSPEWTAPQAAFTYSVHQS